MRWFASTDPQLRALEDFGNDDLQLLLLEEAAAAYATSELHFLLRQLNMKQQRLAHYRRQLTFLAILLPMLLSASIFFCLLDRLPITYFLLGFAGLIIGVLSAGFYQLRRDQQRLLHGDVIALRIQEELSRRRRDAEIY